MPVEQRQKRRRVDEGRHFLRSITVAIPSTRRRSVPRVAHRASSEECLNPRCVGRYRPSSAHPRLAADRPRKACRSQPVRAARSRRGPIRCERATRRRRASRMPPARALEPRLLASGDPLIVVELHDGADHVRARRFEPPASRSSRFPRNRTVVNRSRGTNISRFCGTVVNRRLRAPWAGAPAGHTAAHVSPRRRLAATRADLPSHAVAPIEGGIMTSLSDVMMPPSTFTVRSAESTYR